jgi:hypothetical protein
VFLPYTYFSIQEIRWSHDVAADGSTLFVSVRQPQPNSIQRWIARTARRKEAPDEDANGPSTLIFNHSIREDNCEKDFDAPKMGEAHSRHVDRGYSGDSA